MELISTHPIKKSDLGFHGNLFGGSLLKWIDGSAAGYAMQLCDTPRMVTVSIDKCNFEKPAREGQLKTQIKFVHIDEEGNPIPIGEKGRRRIQTLIDANSK